MQVFLKRYGVSCCVFSRGSEGKSRLRNIEFHSLNDTTSLSTRQEYLTEIQIKTLYYPTDAQIYNS